MQSSATPWLWRAGLIVLYGVILTVTGALASGCTSSTPSGGSGTGGSGSGGGADTPTASTTDISAGLGPLGRFTFEGDSTSDSTALPIDVSFAVPNLPAASATIGIDPAKVTMQLAGRRTEASATLAMRIATSGAADVCNTGTALADITLALDTETGVTVTPASVDVPADALPALSTGNFEVCLAVDSAEADEVELSAFEIAYTTPTDFSTLTCEQIFSARPVQDALETLTLNDLTFALNEGNTPITIENSYFMTDTVSFDPDEFDTEGVLTGTITFSNQSGSMIERSGFGASIQHRIEGTDGDVTMCLLARTNNPTCDQTIARIESVSLSADGEVFDGTYLAVVIEENASTDVNCGDPGDFNFGTLRFRLSGTSDTTGEGTTGDDTTSGDGSTTGDDGTTGNDTSAGGDTGDNTGGTSDDDSGTGIGL
jgi:hypothetical protein